MWTVVDFGKWRGKGKTLPQILLNDPDWFFWAIENDAFAKKGRLATEARMLLERAKGIKIPKNARSHDRVRYWFAPDGKFSRIELMNSHEPAHHGSSSEMRMPYLDLSVPRSTKNYDKLGYKLMMSGLKYYWFGNKPFTKARVEAFFDDPINFV